MGNSQKNNQKLISTAWLGVNDEWSSIMKEKLSRLSEEWVVPSIKCLDRFSSRDQTKFRNQVKLILTKQMKEDKYEELFNKSQVFLNSNEYLRQDFQLGIPISELTISTNTNSIGKINDNQSISSKNQDSLFMEDQCSQIQQFYVFIYCVNDALISQKHPFIHLMNQFKEWAINKLINIKNPQHKIQQMKQKLQKFQSSSDLFLNFLIHSLNEYLGDFGDEISEEGPTKYIKDKQNYYNLFLSHIFNETLISHLMDILKVIHQSSQNNCIKKIKHMQSKVECFEIPKKYLTHDKPFLQEISCLSEAQQLIRPTDIFYCFMKTYWMIKDHLARSASSFLIFQVTNYVIVHSNIEYFHALLHLLELFYCNSPILLKYNQSLEFIQNILIS
ncbi:unnamed protein product (macronuclear) [Paramecium tetraurelia]|uniref:VPS9 domain-containing protein n=1 Tax=Paramecium tetraurelia TaxID=5888 RepID=A0C3Y9_PARTE|nr:uncharacterized protein GSPATT00034986001 [Paramecium tetraurelia]CAK65506.1 unnamed protein product [Paramecium tetraurelia]|eukprot:XP_001432903.1 hypothetical protein (macronuclear) [Paramecium tetraurelia strain d4-2]